MEIFCALLPELYADAASVDALIADFLVHQQDMKLAACSGCAGNYEEPESTVGEIMHSEAPDEEPSVPVEKLSEQPD